MKTTISTFMLMLFLSLFFDAHAQNAWEPKALNTLPNGYYFSDVSIVSEMVLWAVAFDYTAPTPPVPPDHLAKILRSTDGGDIWEVTDIEEIFSRYSFDIHAFDINHAIITTQNLQSTAGRGLWQTEDGGKNWTELRSGNAGGVWLHFFDDQEGICINRSQRTRTTNGEVNRVNSSNTGEVFCKMFRTACPLS